MGQEHGIALNDPFFAGNQLISAPSRTLYGLAKVEKAGEATWDPSSSAWYASANGKLVRVEPDGTLPVILDNVQGTDVDVRAGIGLAVSREPRVGIVLHVLGNALEETTSPHRPSPPFGPAGMMPDVMSTHQLLLSGDNFFNPRFSPDGTRILVSESRASGGHIWVVTPDGMARDLGQGYAPAWHPDGEHVVFCRVSHDGLQVTDADLFMVNTVTMVETRLTATVGTAETEPAVSPDGQRLVFVDALTGRIEEIAFPSLANRPEVHP